MNSRANSSLLPPLCCDDDDDNDDDDADADSGDAFTCAGGGGSSAKARVCARAYKRPNDRRNRQIRNDAPRTPSTTGDIYDTANNNISINSIVVHNRRVCAFKRCVVLPIDGIDADELMRAEFEAPSLGGGRFGIVPLSPAVAVAVAGAAR